MTRTITAMELRRSLGTVLNEVSLQAHEIVIERAGKPMARIVPVASGTRGQAASRMRALRSLAGMLKRTPLPVDPQAWVNSLRAEDHGRAARLH